MSTRYSKCDVNFLAIFQLSLIKLLFSDNHHQSNVYAHLPLFCSDLNDTTSTPVGKTYENPKRMQLDH